jgi:serine/threonine protein kinase
MLPEYETSQVIAGIYEVVRVICRKGGDVAILHVRNKILHLDFVLKLFPEKKLDEFGEECKINNSLSTHPRILKSFWQSLYTSSVTPIRVQGVDYGPCGYLRMPYCRHGSLVDLVLNTRDKGIAIPTPLVRYMARQMVEGLMQLHLTEGLAHCDVKPDNVVIKDDLTLAFIDFAQAMPVDEWTDYVCGTQEYWPPEVRLARRFGRRSPYIPAAVDIFTLGMTIFILAFQQMPFEKATPDDPLYGHLSKKNYQGFQNAHPATRSEPGSSCIVDEKMLVILVSMLNQDTSLRPTISQLYNSEWIQ